MMLATRWWERPEIAVYWNRKPSYDLLVECFSGSRYPDRVLIMLLLSILLPLPDLE